jgi:hypothetical protein
LPSRQGQNWGIGTAYEFQSLLLDVAVLADMRQLYFVGGSTTKKIFTGLELDVPFVTLRGGLYQGYWTAGVLVKILPMFDLEISSFAEELDSASGLRKNRYYLIGLSLGIDVQNKAQKKQRWTLDAIK